MTSYFQLLHHEIERILIKKDYATSAQSLCGGKSQCSVTCCIIVIIVAVCSDDIEVSPGAQCTELISSGRESLLLVLGMYLQELFPKCRLLSGSSTGHPAASPACVCVSISVPLNPSRSPRSGTRTRGTKLQSNLCLLVKIKCSGGSNKWFDLY